MRTSILLILIMAAGLLLSACGPAEPLITTVILPTVIKETQVVKITQLVTQVIVVTVEVPVQVAEEIPTIVPELPPIAQTEAPPTPALPIVPLVEAVQWSSLLVPRAQHTATLLLDGRILTAGGSTWNNEQLAEVEIFDPATGISTRVASMNNPRHDHTATLLKDGCVLIAGGYNTHQLWLGDSEVYDPATDTWTVIPMLATHGVQHTATLLKDGRVLVAGGVDGSGWGTDRVEIFDPHTNSWWGAMPLNSDRASHTAQLLQDGRVLIAGGAGVLGYPEIGDALIYDPNTNSWTATNPMFKPRIYAQSALLPDGRVLVAGGINLEDTVAGGPPSQLSNSAEIYDPNLNTWFPTGNLTVARYGHVMLVLQDGRVMITGGVRDYDWYWSDSSMVREIEIWDPRSGDWSIGYQLPLPGVYSTGLVLADGRAWLAGGKAGVHGEVYLANTWMITP